MSPASYQTAPPRDVCTADRPLTSSCRLARLCSAVQSGKRDSNPRPQPWQGCALPTELFPQADEDSSVRPSTRATSTRRPAARRGSGGEGDRTPDLVNAIHALSQLSYAPVILPAPGFGAAAARKRSQRPDVRQANETAAHRHPPDSQTGYLVDHAQEAARRRRTGIKRPSKRPADTSPEPYSDDLTTAEILAQSPPGQAPARPEAADLHEPRRLRRRPGHPRPVPLRGQQDAPAHRRSRRSRSPAGSAPATRRRCRSWSSATCGSSSRWPRSTRTAASRSPT